jgi:hypothetical protein
MAWKITTGRSRNQIVLLPDSIEDYAGDDNAVQVIGAYINGPDLSDLNFSCLLIRVAKTSDTAGTLCAMSAKIYKIFPPPSGLIFRLKFRLNFKNLYYSAS